MAAQVEIEAKYEGYVKRQKAEVERREGQDGVSLPEDLDYAKVRGLSNEVRQTLTRQRPDTIGRAARLQGITPSAISLLLVHLKARRGPARKKQQRA